MFSINAAAAREQYHHEKLDWTPRVECPICGRTNDNCTVAIAGGFIKLAYCGRIEEGSIKQNAGGQHLHVIDDGDDRPPVTALPKPKGGPAEFANHVRTLRYFQECPLVEFQRDRVLRGLEQTTGASAAAWRAIGATYFGPGIAQFPEKNADGEVVGIGKRVLRSGKKFMVDGSGRGLTYADSLFTTCDVRQVLLPEGASDTAACFDLGIAAIGCPNNRMVVAAADLIGMAAATTWGDDVDVIVIGERDQKPDGSWPGRDGAVSRAQQLAKRLPHLRIRAVLPPEGHKDVRAFHNAQSKEAVADGTARQKLLSSFVPIDADLPRSPTSLAAPSAEPEPHEHDPVNCRCADCTGDRLDAEMDTIEDAAFCPNRYSQTSVSATRYISGTFACKNWQCQWCRKHVLVPKYADHFRRIFQPTATVYRYVADSEKQLNAIVSRVKRQGGEQITIPITMALSMFDGKLVFSNALLWVVYSTVETRTACQWDKWEALQLTGAGAVEWALGDLSRHKHLSYPHEKCAISASKRWSLSGSKLPKPAGAPVDTSGVPIAIAQASARDLLPKPEVTKEKIERNAVRQAARERGLNLLEFENRLRGIGRSLIVDISGLCLEERISFHARVVELSEVLQIRKGLPRYDENQECHSEPAAQFARPMTLEQLRLPLKLAG